MGSKQCGDILLTFNHCGYSLTLNEASRGTWRSHNRLIADWRRDFGILGLTTRKKIIERVGIEVRPTVRLGGGVADAAAHAYCAKAAIDGLVDAGVLVNDNRAYVAWQRFHAPRVDPQVPSGMVRLTLELILTN